GRDALPPAARQRVRRRHGAGPGGLQRRSRCRPQVQGRSAVRRDPPLREEGPRLLLPAQARREADPGRIGACTRGGAGRSVMDPSTPRALDEGGVFGDDADAAENQEFDRNLVEASDSLQRGDAGGARQLLEKALRYKPRNQRARNLLGLSLFKLGELEKAESIYRSLIEDHPADPTLRVNLGLVFLKSNSSADAVRCFETALDLASDHQKAQNYLGLALAQKGELARAREGFLKDRKSVV